MGNKYKAQAVYHHLEWDRPMNPFELEKFRNLSNKSLKAHNILYFASRFEYRVYQHLVELFGAESVVCQCPVSIYPASKCCPNGKNWTVDFMVRANRERKRSVMFVEAKGMVTNTFMDNLIALEMFNQQVFNCLYVLFESAIPTKNRIIKNLLKSQGENQPNHPSKRILTLDKFLRSQHLNLQYYSQKEEVAQ